MFDLVELYMHWQAGRSQVQLWQSLGMDRKTIRKYLAPAEAEGIGVGGTALTAEQWAEKIAEWFPGLDDPGVRAVTWPLIEPHRGRVKAWLDDDVTVATIAQRLRDDHELGVSESSVRRWIATHFAEEVARAKVTVPRGEVPPGAEAQIDYGKLGMWLDPATARRVAVWAFVMVLSCSRHMFVRPVIRMDQTTWCACHVEAFEFFGGVPARLVCENVPRNIFGQPVGRHPADDAQRLIDRGHHRRQRLIQKRQHHPKPAPRQPRAKQLGTNAVHTRTIPEVILQPHPGLRHPRPMHPPAPDPIRRLGLGDCSPCGALRTRITQPDQLVVGHIRADLTPRAIHPLLELAPIRIHQHVPARGPSRSQLTALPAHRSYHCGSV
jgi:transposase